VGPRPHEATQAPPSTLACSRVPAHQPVDRTDPPPGVETTGVPAPHDPADAAPAKHNSQPRLPAARRDHPHPQSATATQARKVFDRAIPAVRRKTTLPAARTGASEAGRLRQRSGTRPTGAFGDPEQWRFGWDRPNTCGEWLDQVPTFGGHTQLPPAKLEDLLAGIGTAIHAAGGSITMCYTRWRPPRRGEHPLTRLDGSAGRHCALSTRQAPAACGQLQSARTPRLAPGSVAAPPRGSVPSGQPRPAGDGTRLHTSPQASATPASTATEAASQPEIGSPSVNRPGQR
jgi:hypothetical protein